MIKNFKLISLFFLYLGIVLFPFQNLSLSLYKSNYDYAAFALALFCISIHFSYNKNKNIISIDNNFLIFSAFFITLNTIIWIIFDTPFYRFLSGTLWSFGLFSIIIFRKKIEINFYHTFIILIISIFISSIFAFNDYFIKGIPRPQAYFDEPSFAGLIYFSTSMAFFGCFLSGVFKKPYSLFLVIFFLYFLYLGILTKSLHLFSFFISLLLFVCFNKRLIFILLLYLVPFLLIILYALYVFNFNFNSIYYHIYSRFNLNELNLSTYTWLYGAEQAFEVISSSPVFGFGLGATGHFDFVSYSNDILFSIGRPDQNRYDSYSLFFRLIIEVGLFFTLLIIFVILNLYKKIYEGLNSLSKKESFSVLFMRFFSTTAFIGLLIKEPVYSFSITYLGIIFFAISFSKISISSKNL